MAVNNEHLHISQYSLLRKERQNLLISHTFQLQASSDEDSKKKELSESRLENLSSHLEDAMQESGSGSDNGESLLPWVISKIMV